MTEQNVVGKLTTTWQLNEIGMIFPSLSNSLQYMQFTEIVEIDLIKKINVARPGQYTVSTPCGIHHKSQQFE